MQRFESARRLQLPYGNYKSTSLNLGEKSLQRRAFFIAVSRLLAPEQTIKLSSGVEPPRIVIAADRFSIDKNLRHGPSLR